VGIVVVFLSHAVIPLVQGMNLQLAYEICLKRLGLHAPHDDTAAPPPVTWQLDPNFQPLPEETIPRLRADRDLMVHEGFPVPEIDAKLIRLLVQEGRKHPESLLEAVEIYQQRRIIRLRRPEIDHLLQETRPGKMSLFELVRTLDRIEYEHLNAIKHEGEGKALEPEQRAALSTLMEARSDAAKEAFSHGSSLRDVDRKVDAATVPWIKALLSHGHDSPLLAIEALHLLVKRPGLLRADAGLRTMIEQLSINETPASELLEQFKKAGSGRPLAFERPIQVQFRCAYGDTISPGFQQRFEELVSKTQNIAGLHISPGASMNFDSKAALAVVPPEHEVIERLVGRDYVVIVVDAPGLRDAYQKAAFELSDPGERAKLIGRLRAQGQTHLADQIARGDFKPPNLYFSVDIFPKNTEDPLQLLPLLDRIILHETTENGNHLVLVH
jgi:hypothetical protein